MDMEPKHITLHKLDQALEKSAKLAVAQARVKRLLLTRRLLRLEADTMEAIDPGNRENALQVGVKEVQIEMCKLQIKAWRQKVQQYKAEEATDLDNLFDDVETVEEAKYILNSFIDLGEQFSEEIILHKPYITDLNKQLMKEEDIFKEIQVNAMDMRIDIQEEVIANQMAYRARLQEENEMLQQEQVNTDKE